MKRFVFVAVLFAIACDPSNFTAPTASAGGVLPAWMFAYQGRLVRPKPGTYEVFFSKEISRDLELSSHADYVLQAANSLSSASGIMFQRTNHANASVSFRLDPTNPYAAANAGWGDLRIANSYECISASMGIQDREKFLTNIPLHELGHFLFGPGHSQTPEDIMNPTVRDYRRMSFSVNERTLWLVEQQFPQGTLQ